MALTDKLTAIADAIRAKTGETAPLGLVDMPTAIASIETGGGGGFDPEKMYTVRVNVPGRTTVTVYTKTSAYSNPTESTLSTSRTPETYNLQPTSFIAFSTTPRMATNLVSIGLCNGLEMYIVNGDGNVSFM